MCDAVHVCLNSRENCILWCLDCCEATVGPTGHKRHLRVVVLSNEAGKNVHAHYHDPLAAQQFDGSASPQGQSR